jgi:hypothetical protein
MVASDIIYGGLCMKAAKVLWSLATLLLALSLAPPSEAKVRANIDITEVAKIRKEGVGVPSASFVTLFGRTAVDLFGPFIVKNDFPCAAAEVTPSSPVDPKRISFIFLKENVGGFFESSDPVLRIQVTNGPLFTVLLSAMTVVDQPGNFKFATFDMRKLGPGIIYINKIAVVAVANSSGGGGAKILGAHFKVLNIELDGDSPDETSLKVVDDQADVLLNFHEQSVIVGK